jgi:hypothetical protein
LSVIALKRVERQPGESDAELVVRVVAAFAAGSKSNADTAAKNQEGIALEAYKRGKADGMREVALLCHAIAVEISTQRMEHHTSESSKGNALN